VRDTSARIGVAFDPWQAELNRCVLAKTGDGGYAAGTVVLSVPRQAGKTFDIGGLVFADSIINPGTTTIWTAHRFKVARETFDVLRGWARASELAAHIDCSAITTGAGNETIPFRNGSRIVFAARERGAIRGFSAVSRLILDEAQILTDAALSDLAPTMNTVANPQMILTGTPPKAADAGDVFTRLRTEALRGESDGVLYVEFSAASDADPDDRGQWRAANPSHPGRTSEKAIVRLRQLLTGEDFRREALGIWDATSAHLVFGSGAWEACKAPEPHGLTMLAVGVAVSRNLTSSAIVAAGVDGDGNTVVKPLRVADEVGWVPAEVKRLQDEHGVPAVIDGGGPGASLIPGLQADGVRLRVAATKDVLDSCERFHELVRGGTLRHAGYPELDRAVAGATQRSVGERWAWGRRQSSEDISPLEAATLAAWGVDRPARRSAYAERGVLTV
jgi:hypothetical protein